jgi:hypothetical protein
MNYTHSMDFYEQDKLRIERTKAVDALHKCEEKLRLHGGLSALGKIPSGDRTAEVLTAECDKLRASINQIDQLLPRK